MKRLWLGVTLLVLLLALGIGETVCVCKLTEPVSRKLFQASQAAREADLVSAQTLMEEARQEWQGHWAFLAAMNHHGPMEEIDGLFAQAQALLENGAASDVSACCARLGEMIRALGEAHSVNLRNLL